MRHWRQAYGLQVDNPASAIHRSISARERVCDQLMVWETFKVYDGIG